MLRSFWRWANARPHPKIGVARYVLEYGFLRFAVPFVLGWEFIGRLLIRKQLPFSDPVALVVLFVCSGMLVGVVGWIRDVYLPRFDVKH
jgi:hypothetical protein